MTALPWAICTRIPCSNSRTATGIGIGIGIGKYARCPLSRFRKRLALRNPLRPQPPQPLGPQAQCSLGERRLWTEGAKGHLSVNRNNRRIRNICKSNGARADLDAKTQPRQQPRTAIPRTMTRLHPGVPSHWSRPRSMRRSKRSTSPAPLGWTSAPSPR